MPSEMAMSAASPTEAIDFGQVLRAVRSVLLGSCEFHLHEPVFRGRELDYLKECIDTGWVSTAGPFVSRFETMLARRCEVEHAVAVVNGTAALQVALEICGVQRDHEVLIPALTFAATAAAVRHSGAVPHFVDVEAASLGIGASALRRHLETVGVRRDGRLINRITGRVVAAMVPVHIFGSPADMEPLLALAAEFGLRVVEDATESIGSECRGRPCGSIAQVGVLSFNGNKIVTTGGGGALLTDDAELARRARHLTTTAKLPHRWAYRHDAVGYNFRLPNINAALGCAQLEQLDGFLNAKRSLYERYRSAFGGVPGCRLFEPPPYATSNHWLIALLLDEPDAARLYRLLDMLHDNGIKARPSWDLLHRMEPYRDCPAADLPVSENLAQRIVCLPSGAGLGAMP